MIYDTKRLVLNPFTKKQITDEYLNWFNNPIVTRFNSHGLGSYIKQDAEKYLENSKDDIIFAVYEKDKYIHIGNISLQRINYINRSAEFACVFGKTEYWGKGYATESLKVLFEHGFNKLNLHRIWSGTAAPNIGMQKVFEKLGMMEEGKFFDGAWLNGQYHDIICYGLLAEEWRDNKKGENEL